MPHGQAVVITPKYEYTYLVAPWLRSRSLGGQVHMAAAFAPFLTGRLQHCPGLSGMDNRVRLPWSSVSAATEGIFNKLLVPYCLLGPNLASYLAVAKKKNKREEKGMDDNSPLTLFYFRQCVPPTKDKSKEPPALHWQRKERERLSPDWPS